MTHLLKQVFLFASPHGLYTWPWAQLASVEHYKTQIRKFCTHAYPSMHNGRTTHVNAAHPTGPHSQRSCPARGSLQLQQEGIDGFSKVLETVLVVLTPESLGTPEQGKARREKLCVAI